MHQPIGRACLREREREKESERVCVCVCVCPVSECVCVCVCVCVCTQWCPTHYDPTDCNPPGSCARQEYWSGLPFPPPGDLPNPGTEPTAPETPGTEPTAPETPALAGRFFTTEPPGKPYLKIQMGKQMGIKAMGWSSSQQVGYGGTPNTDFSTLKLCVLGLVTAHL